MVICPVMANSSQKAVAGGQRPSTMARKEAMKTAAMTSTTAISEIPRRPAQSPSRPESRMPTVKAMAMRKSVEATCCGSRPPTSRSQGAAQSVWSAIWAPQVPAMIGARLQKVRSR